MAVSRRLQPGEEGLWPSSQESQDRINELAAKSQAARARSRSPEMRAFLTDVAGLPQPEEMTRAPKAPDPLPAGGVSPDVVTLAQAFARNPEAAAREASIRWEEKVRADERSRIEAAKDDPEPEYDYLDLNDDASEEALPEDTNWNHGPAAYEDPLADVDVTDTSEGMSWEEMEYHRTQESLRETYQQQGQEPPVETDDSAQATLAQADLRSQFEGDSFASEDHGE